MKNYYTIYMDHNVAGTVTTEKYGLYLNISCRCKLLQDGVYRLIVREDDHYEDLGILLRDDSGYFLTTKVPKKRLISENLTFEIVKKESKNNGKFIPLDSNSPLLYIPELKKCYLVIREGQIGLVLP